ncbi:MAG: response regulator transcription factor [Fulvivirga sp.]
MPNILLAEDDPALGVVIKDNLQQNGYTVDLANDGNKAIDLFKSKTFDICLLDVMLPKKDGFAVAQSIRSHNQNVPILFLTAKSMEEDRITGFQSGGDDYITKPFSMKELTLRIEVFLKRSSSNNELLNKSYRIGSFHFDYQNLTLSNNDNTFQLTAKEALVLKYLCSNQGKVVKRNDILEAIWGTDDYFLGRSMDVFISRLRKYLKSDSSINIKNIHGVGFMLEITG